MAASPIDPLAERRRLLQALLADADGMLEQLAHVVGIAPPLRLVAQPGTCLAELSAFCARTDFEAATADGRTWMLNRIGLVIARDLIARHGGQLCVQNDPARPFHGHFVVADMRSPVLPGARLDPFALAHRLLHASPKPALLPLLAQAEAELLGGA